MTILPSFATGEPLSATKLNALTDALAYVDGVSRSARNPVRCDLDIDAGETITGYILHQYNTLYYSVVDYAHLTLTVNGVGVTLTGNTGSATLTGLTAGNVYMVTLKSSANNAGVNYIYEGLTETYGDGPTTFTGASAAQVVTGLNLVRDYTDDLLNLAQCPPTVFQRANAHRDSWDRDEDNAVVVWDGWLRHIHNSAEYRFIHAVIGGVGGNEKVSTALLINGTTVLTRKNGYPADAGQTVITRHYDAGHGQDSRCEEVYGTLDISGLGLTVGTWYRWTLRISGAGTSKPMGLDGTAIWLAETGGTPTSATPTAGYERFWVDGAKTATEANLNTFVTSINALHPGAASPTSPMYYDNPVQWQFDTTWYTNRRSKYLAYRWRGNGTPEISVREAKYAMPAKTGNQYADIDKVPNLFYGQRFGVDDCYFVGGTDDISTLAIGT